jgi:hypothetical protein
MFRLARDIRAGLSAFRSHEAVKDENRYPVSLSLDYVPDLTDGES